VTTAPDPVAALEAECSALRDRMANLLLSSGERLAAERARARAEALQEVADELTERLTSSTNRTVGWRAGIRDAINAVRARAGIDSAAGLVPRQQRAPSA
jgi:hypothetical protein